MHVLHRPHLPHPVAITAVCAALAIVLTLLLAGSVNDLTSASAGGSPTAPPTAVPSTSAGAGWNLSPFTSLLRSPVRVPWTAGAGPGDRITLLYAPSGHSHDPTQRST